MPGKLQVVTMLSLASIAMAIQNLQGHKVVRQDNNDDTTSFVNTIGVTPTSTVVVPVTPTDTNTALVTPVNTATVVYTSPADTDTVRVTSTAGSGDGDDNDQTATTTAAVTTTAVATTTSPAAVATAGAHHQKVGSMLGAIAAGGVMAAAVL